MLLLVLFSFSELPQHHDAKSSLYFFLHTLATPSQSFRLLLHFEFQSISRKSHQLESVVVFSLFSLFPFSALQLVVSSLSSSQFFLLTPEESPHLFASSAPIFISLLCSLMFILIVTKIEIKWYPYHRFSHQDMVQFP